MQQTAKDDRIGTTLPPAIRRRLRLQSAVTGKPMAQIHAAALDAYLRTDAQLAADLVAAGGIDDISD